MIDRAWSGAPRSGHRLRGAVLAGGLVGSLAWAPVAVTSLDGTITAAAVRSAHAPRVDGAHPAIDTVSPAGGRTAAGGKGYRLQYNADGSVVRWNPCTAVHYRMNLARAPKGAERDVREAIKRISAATGIRFVEDGRTSTLPQRSYGADAKPWKGEVPPLVIAWARPGRGSGRSDALASGPEQLGVGGWRTAWWTDAEGSHAPRVVTGFVVLHADRYARLKAGFRGAGRGSVLLHELAHVMGLDHVDDRGQLMYPRLTGRSGFASGDLAGLRRVGRQTKTAADCLR